MWCPFYNPKKVFFEIYEQLDEEHRFLFIRNIIEKTNIKNFLAAEKELLIRYLNVLGYSLIKDFSNLTNGYSINTTTKGEFERSKDISFLEEEIGKNFPRFRTYYNEAVSSFANGNYSSCVDNCRTLLEKLFEEKGDSTSFSRTVLNLTKEEVKNSDGIILTSRDAIFKNWIETKKGSNKYRFFITTYSAMSGLGIHGEQIPTRKDALLFLRVLEDCLIWVL